MDIYSYVNSKTIGDYLRSINYPCSTREAAWLVYHCYSIPLEEKHEAWKKIIREMPNQPVKEEGDKGIHSLIYETLTMDERLHELFEKQEVGAVYSARFYCKGDYCWCEDPDRLYGSLDECWKTIDEDQDLGIETVQIKKITITTGQTIIASFSPKRILMDIYSTDAKLAVTYPEFDDLCLYFPVPFQKGDIVIEKENFGPPKMGCCTGPFVLDGVLFWEKVRTTHLDDSDMTAWGYFQDENGNIYHETMYNYMDLEYYEGPFKGTSRFLLALSNFLKGKIGLDLLLNAYSKSIFDELAAPENHNLGRFTDEGLKLAGITL